MAPADAGTDADAAPARAPQPERRDWPAIEQRHPDWWQVQRAEMVDGKLSWLLVAETETETLAFTVAMRQASQARVWHRDDRRPPWLSFRAPRENKS